MKRLILILLMSKIATPVVAETPRLTLDSCMRYAVEHAVEVRQRELALDDLTADRREALAGLFPRLDGSVSGVTNFGRSIDPATNAYTNVTTFSNSYGLSASLPLFAGLRGINAVRAAEAARRQGRAEAEAARDETALAVLSAYLDAVYRTEAVGIAREQLEAVRATLELTRRQFELGLKSAADVAEVESQEADRDYLLTTAENELELAGLRLRRAMNWPADRPLEVETDLAVEPAVTASSQGEVLAHALEHNPRLAAAGHAVEQRRLQRARARGACYPSLHLYGGYNTNYFVDFDNRGAYDRFGLQLRNNRGGYVQAVVSIPLFNGLGIRQAKRRADNAWRSARLARAAEERAVENDVAEAWQQMQGYGKEFVAGQKKVRAARIAYEGAARKFEKGLISALDLHTAANSLLQAESDRLRARLHYIAQCRIVDYYNGESLIKQ